MNAMKWIYGSVCILCLAILSACGGGGGGSTAPGTLQIVATSFDVTEGRIVNIRVARSGGTNGVVSVDFSTVDGTAVSGTDYTAASGTLTWANGVSGNQTISIPITDDGEAEYTESFTLVLSNVSCATLGGNSSATVDIIDNDTAVVSAFGAITALSSATVNGIRYDTNATDVAISGQPAQFSDLEFGQVVAVKGDVNFSNATGTADEIGYSATVIGPVESIDVPMKHLIVMGQTVFTNADTVFDSSIDPDTFVGLSVGATAGISGFRNAAGEIIATRIAPDTTSAGVQLIGTVSGVDVVNMLFAMERLTVDYGSAALIDLPGGIPVNGQLVMVLGSLTGGILAASEIVSVVNVTTTPGDRSILSGIITRFVSPTDFDLNGFPVTTDANTNFANGVADDLQTDVEVTIDGEVTRGGDTVMAHEVHFGRLVSEKATLTFDFDNFTNISMTGFFKLTVNQGLDFSVDILVTSDLVDDVQASQSGDTVSFEQALGSNNTHIHDVFVTLPVLDRIDVGAGSLANVTLRDFDQLQMVVNVDGVSLLRGEALRIGDLTATVSGVSVLDFGDIRPIGNANIDISGVSQATLNMDVGTTMIGSVETGQGTGNSTLFYFGTNVTANVTTDSISKVIRLGDTRP